MRYFALVLLVSAVLMFAGCGTGSRTPAAPTTSMPWFGAFGNVLISNQAADGHTDYLWVGFHDPLRFDEAKQLAARTAPAGWIGGKVVLDPRSPIGFYFAPTTTVAAEITAEGAQTTLDAIRGAPAQFADGNTWYVPLRPVAVR